jgi:hypothetical protein
MKLREFVIVEKSQNKTAPGMPYIEDVAEEFHRFMKAFQVGAFTELRNKRVQCSINFLGQFWELKVWHWDGSISLHAKGAFYVKDRPKNQFGVDMKLNNVIVIVNKTRAKWERIQSMIEELGGYHGVLGTPESEGEDNGKILAGFLRSITQNV